MPNFRIISNVSKINLSQDWIDSTKFKSRDRIVDASGNRVDATYTGRKYRLVSKKEIPFTPLERAGRGLLGIMAVILTLGFASLFKPVRKLLTKKKTTVRFGTLISSSKTSRNKSPLPVPAGAGSPPTGPKPTFNPIPMPAGAGSPPTGPKPTFNPIPMPAGAGSPPTGPKPTGAGSPPTGIVIPSGRPIPPLSAPTAAMPPYDPQLPIDPTCYNQAKYRYIGREHEEFVNSQLHSFMHSLESNPDYNFTAPREEKAACFGAPVSGGANGDTEISLSTAVRRLLEIEQPGAPENMRIPRRDRFAFPVLVLGGHWTLIFVDRTKKTIEFYNSTSATQYSGLQAEIEEVQKILKANHEGDYKFQIKVTEQLQHDQFQCGPWVLLMLEHRLQNDQFDPNTLRKSKNEEVTHMAATRKRVHREFLQFHIRNFYKVAVKQMEKNPGAAEKWLMRMRAVQRHLHEMDVAELNQ